MRSLFASFVLLSYGFCLLCAANPVLAQSVSGLRLGENNDRTRFVIDVNKEVSAQVFTLSDPYRLVIDLPHMDFQLDGQGVGEGRGLVDRYRYGAFDQDTSRIVLDLKKPALLEKSFTLPPQGNASHRLVFDLKPTSRATFLADVRKPKQLERSAPIRSELNPAPSVRQANAPRVIVLDPGHGGTDPGAPGATGRPEKYVTLAVAQEAARQLNATGRYRAFLTRSGDVYIPLRKRYSIAREKRADLFISLHADSFKNPRVRGATVYTLSERASDAEAAALSARENKSDVLAGVNLGQEAPEVANILIDLAQRETMNYSSRFANTLIPELKNRIRIRRNSHRFAGFLVLKAPDVPSVLLEMGYLSNPQDAQLLSSASGQGTVAAAVVSGIDRYFEAIESERF